MTTFVGLFFVAAIAAGYEGVASSDADAAPVTGIPDDYIGYYQDAAAVCPGMDWHLLAAVGYVETKHGQADMAGVSSGENSAGAGGPMQFLGATFQGVKSRHPDIDGSRYDPQAATKAAAYYLCENGAGDGDVDGALYTYNHSSAYVHKVEAHAAALRDRY